jgi:hypothetical protein
MLGSSSSPSINDTLAGITGSVRGQPVPYGSPMMKAQGDGRVKASTGPDNPESLFNTLMQIAAGGSPDASTGGPTGNNPYHVAVKVLQHQYAQAGAQTDQNIADIGSWYGQYQGQARHAVKANKRAGRASAKDAARFSGDILSGIADPNVARATAADAERTQRYIGRSNTHETQFDRRVAVDAGREEAYQKLVQQRLGAQEQAGIRDQIAMAKAQQSSYAQSQGGGGIDQIMSVLRLLPEDQRLQALGVPGKDDGFSTDDRSGLAAALSGASQMGQNPDTKMPTFAYKDFNSLLEGLQHGASSGGFNLNDPQIRDAYRQWIAANLLPIWNQTQGGPNYALQGKSFREIH